MFTNNKLAKSVRLAIAFGAAATALPASQAFAADEEEIEKIQVTGSAINRTQMEGALPIDVLSSDDIEKSGVGSVPELIANLPSMQGFIAEGESVGGGGGGMSTASLRDLGSQYTLVLLNGRRMASADSGGTIDLNSIPLSAIERVEILKDGASSVYGSDAIAGVVNFILKKDVSDTTVTARYDAPADTSMSSFSITSGFGDLDTDGYNIMAAYSREEKDNLRSVDRDFAKTGFLEFNYAGQELIGIAGSTNAIPGNAYLRYNTVDENGDYVMRDVLDDDGNQTFDEDGNLIQENVTATYGFNPYRQRNNNCHTTSAPSGAVACQFDYTSTLEIQPESTRDNIFLQGLFMLTDDIEGYATLSHSKFEMVTRIAPYPTGGLPFDKDLQILKDEVYPYIPASAPANVMDDLVSVAARWRVLPGGNRTTEWNTTTNHFVAGLRGEMNEIYFDLSVTAADAEREENRLTGYPITAAFLPLATSGEINIFADPAELSAEQAAKVKATMYAGPQAVTDTSMMSIEGTASMELFEMGGGAAYFATGFDYRQVDYQRRISDSNRDSLVLFESPGNEFEMERDTYGAFVEIVLPVFEDFELTASMRYDNIGGITETKRTWNETKDSVVDPATAAYTPSTGTYDYVTADVNDDKNDTTYKVQFAYRPSDAWLLRGAIGTGFKAPSMRQIAEPRVEFGVTSSSYDCPAGLAPNLAAYCLTDKLQYEQYREGNADLEPEKSEQMTLGFVWSGEDSSFSLDYWSVNMEDQVARLTETQIFGDPVTYVDRFTTKINPATGNKELAIIRAADNIGESENAGLDYQWNISNETALGTVRTQLAGTYVIESRSLRVGTEDEWDTALGGVGPGQTVTFRNVFNINNTLVSGDFTHSLNLRYKSGYTDDIAANAFAVAPASDITDTTSIDGSLIERHVSEFIVMDYRGTYSMDNGLDLTLGVKNLMDEQPPFTLNAAAGHQVGFDTRYHDPYGRTVYVQASYTF